MAGEPFDLERLRQNWARAAEPPGEELPARLLAVKAARDPYPEARALLGQIRALALSQVPQREAMLEYFFAEAAGLLARMAGGDPTQVDLGEGGGGQGGGERARGGDAAKAAEDPRARMMELLDELTELLEVFAMVGRH